MTHLVLGLLLLFALPSLEEGRAIPKENAECLPSRFKPDVWKPLEALSNNPDNFTLFSDPAYQALRKAYLSENASAIEEAYWIAYEEIGGKRLYLTSQSTLVLPTAFEIRLEMFYLSFPWILVLFIGFTLSFCFPKLFIFPYLVLLADILFRLFILKRPPVTTMAETYLWVAFVGTTIPLFLKGRPLVRSASLLGTLLFGGLLFFNEKIALSLPPPVLNSSFWLTIHVLMVVGSYALFFLGGLLAHFYLGSVALKRQSHSFFRPIPSLLFTGVILLIAGTLLGGVWAHVSWGRFWDWDPKEAWAFISSLFYLILIHLYRYQRIGPRGLALGAIGGLIVITFTWYGVNYLLGVGLHSYGFGSGRWVPYLFFIALECIFMTLSLALSLTRKNQREKNRREIGDL